MIRHSLLFVVLTLSLAPQASAAQSPAPPPLECVEDVEAPAFQSTLSVTHADEGKAQATWKSESSQADLAGTYALTTHSFFSQVFTYSLEDAASGAPATLKISHYRQVGRGGCGRAGCPTDGGGLSSIAAELETGGKQLSFTCHEKAQ